MWQTGNRERKANKTRKESKGAPKTLLKQRPMPLMNSRMEAGSAANTEPLRIDSGMAEASASVGGEHEEEEEEENGLTETEGPAAGAAVAPDAKGNE